MSEVVIDDGGLSDCSIPPPPPSPPIRVLKSDRRRMDFVADSDASTDEEDHEAAREMMPEVLDDINILEIGDSNETQENVVATKPADEVIRMDTQPNILSNPTPHTILDRFSCDCEVNMSLKWSEDNSIHESISRTDYGGLNYLGSQDPGELSQVNAMHVVDKLVFDDDIGLSQETSTVKATEMKSAPSLSAQVAQCLVNRENPNYSVGKARIFEWVDSPEDEAGGGFFSKRKPFVSKNRINALESKNQLPKHEQIDTCEDRETKNLETYRRRNTLTDSNSMPLPHGLERSERPYISAAKLKEQSDYMDTNSSLGFIEQQIEATDVLGGNYDTFDIGPNTQMAAEAMEVLFHGPPLNQESIEDSSLLNQIPSTSPTKGSRREKATPVKTSLPKRSKRSKEVDMNDVNNPQMLHEWCKSEKELAQVVSAEDSFRHPKRRRTHVFPLGNSNFGNSIRRRLPDILDKAKRETRSTKLRISPSNLDDAFDNSLGIVPYDPALLKDVKEPNSDESKQNISTRRAPVTASYKKGFSKVSASREHIRLEKNERSSDRMFTRRKKKDMASVCVLFSQHLNQDKIKQQKKILARFGALTASSIIEATHFIADKFARTKNMLEAIAMGKPVVTSMWLESCGQASCFVDEKRYVLRDLKKEKEIGFNMLVSLTRASQYPLLQAKRVLITPNVKPDQELVISLVKAACGWPLDRMGRSAMKDQKVSEDFFIISCEEDYKICLPLVKKGVKAFSSELLLNGIVIQKLEFERYRLFLDQMSRYTQ
ncbi:uncharacterized protein LOC109708731 [Ananas comosus]|uniref:Uncharacterized protein LOC109708731 n=1 Tax=Ananas comosus TaxID=4615 RepID=A0A6P5ERG4_ANACO|nr:uncharacterized protein LOC109708731 [Ananas comosus]